MRCSNVGSSGAILGRNNDVGSDSAAVWFFVCVRCHVLGECVGSIAVVFNCFFFFAWPMNGGTGVAFSMAVGRDGVGRGAHCGVGRGGCAGTPQVGTGDASGGAVSGGAISGGASGGAVSGGAISGGGEYCGTLVASSGVSGGGITAELGQLKGRRHWEAECGVWAGPRIGDGTAAGHRADSALVLRNCGELRRRAGTPISEHSEPCSGSVFTVLAGYQLIFFFL